MIRIAFLGADSTHTEAFADRLHAPDGPLAGAARVVAIHGDDPEQARAKAAACGIERVAASVDDALREADLAMVLGRFADSHRAPATAALERGIPTFVDKPFTATAADARALAELSARTGVALCSSSPLRFCPELDDMRPRSGASPAVRGAMACAPANCVDLGDDPRLDSPFFYGIHALEMLLEMSGHDLDGYDVAHHGTMRVAWLRTRSGATAALNLVRDAAEFYSLDLFTADGALHREVALDGRYYERELSFLLERFLPGLDTVPIASSVLAIEILEAMESLSVGDAGAGAC